jgi:hypothetical protein
MNLNNKWDINLEPKRSDRWTLSISGIEAYLITVSKRPSITNDEIVVDYINTKRYYKGKTSWGTIDITLKEAINPSAAAQIYTWLLLHHDSESGAEGYKGEYAKDITLTLFGPDGTEVERWNIKNAWVTSVDFGSLDYSNADIINVSVTLRFDYATLETASTSLPA